ncbi:Ca2+-binding EF-hand superfamily protein [Bradyrhizobium sp. USDA 4448]
MLFALGAVSSALDAIQSLTSSKSSATPQAGSSQNAASNPFAIDGSNSGTSSSAASSANAGYYPQISPDTMNALFAAQSRSTDPASSTSTDRDAALKDLFSQLDANGDGQISKSEFENALGAGGTNLAQADDVFSKLDTDSDGSVSLDEMSKALKGAGGHHGGHHHAQAGERLGRCVGQRLGFQVVIVERRLDHDHLDQRRRLDHDHRHLRRRFQDDDDRAGRLQLFEWLRRRQYAL